MTVYRKRHPRSVEKINDCYDEECRMAIELRKEMLGKQNEQSRKAYPQRRKEATGLCQKKNKKSTKLKNILN